MEQQELAEKLGKSTAYISNMGTVRQLLTKLEQAGTEVKMYPKSEEKEQMITVTQLLRKLEVRGSLIL